MSAPTLVLCAVGGPLEAAASGGTGLELARIEDAAGTHHMVARLRELLAARRPACLVLPRPDSEHEGERALAMAAAAALARLAELEFRAGSPSAPPESSTALLGAFRKLAQQRARSHGLPASSAVLSSWNKRQDLAANLEAIRAQTLPFESVVVVDNASHDGSIEMVRRDFPEVLLVVMPHSQYGACETFNIGFACARSEFVAILDDDIVMPPAWLECSTRRLVAEPATTAIVSTQVIEPGMPESYRTSKSVNEERYMSTFRGCASLARHAAIAKAGYYDERLFIYGNERDLTCRLLNLGFRVLQYPGVSVFHKTPFGIKLGKRSLYYHARNAFLSMLKYAPLSDLLRLPFLALFQVLLRGESKEAEGSVRDAVGTIGIGRSVRETPGAWWVLVKASASILYNIPYCWKHRQPCTHEDFELPLK
ncbi:MAG: glycosyltransferase family 2 protein [Planctomycetia bacterium]